jgi:hypothetical protein
MDDSLDRGDANAAGEDLEELLNQQSALLRARRWQLFGLADTTVARPHGAVVFATGDDEPWVVTLSYGSAEAGPLAHVMTMNGWSDPAEDAIALLRQVVIECRRPVGPTPPRELLDSYPEHQLAVTESSGSIVVDGIQHDATHYRGPGAWAVVASIPFGSAAGTGHAAGARNVVIVTQDWPVGSVELVGAPGIDSFSAAVATRLLVEIPDDGGDPRDTSGTLPPGLKSAP